MKKQIKDYILLLVDVLILAVASAIASTVMKLIIYNQYTALELYGYTMIISVLSELAMFFAFKIYNVIIKYTDVSFNLRVAASVGLGAVISFLIMGGVFKDWRFAASFNFMQGVTAFTGVLIVRLIYQVFSSNREKQEPRTSKRIPVMIIGGGWTGNRVVSELLRDNKKFLPVCIIDDNQEIIGKTMQGVKVVGNTMQIDYFAKKYRVKKIIFAIPTATSDARKRIINECMKTGVEVNVLPNLANLLGNADILSTLRKIHIEDLLERDPIQFDQESVNNFVKGKICMVTGGGGSIGSELCRQIANYEPKELIICDVYENNAFDISNEIGRRYPDIPLYTEIVSVTDKAAMEEIFKHHKVDLIFHAAAHKHVPLMEHNPEESVKNNVVGTKVVAELAYIYKAEKFIMVSTDKAVNPTNVMGATKRFCEKIANYYNYRSNGVTSYAVVRFGNVLGSNGSVIHTFNQQIAEGGPITVTHKDIIRYFMTIPEAVSLILQAGVYAKGGEVFILDMGSPVKIVNLAENLIRLAGYKPYRDIDIVFTGLRPGEKLFEELLMNEEGLKKTSNDKIYIGNQSFVCDENVASLYHLLVDAASTNDGVSVIYALMEAVETFNPDLRFHEVMSRDELAVKGNPILKNIESVETTDANLGKKIDVVSTSDSKVDVPVDATVKEEKRLDKKINVSPKSEKKEIKKSNKIASKTKKQSTKQKEIEVKVEAKTNASTKSKVASEKADAKKKTTKKTTAKK